MGRGYSHEGVDLFLKCIKLLLKVFLEFFKGGGEWVGGCGGERRVRGWWWRSSGRREYFS